MKEETAGTTWPDVAFALQPLDSARHTRRPRRRAMDKVSFRVVHWLVQGNLGKFKLP